MRKLQFPLAAVLLACASTARAELYARVHGIVHDSQHQPIRGASIELHSAHSALTFHAGSGDDGVFNITAVPFGVYTLTVRAPGFTASSRTVVLTSGTAPVLHVELSVAGVEEHVSVSARGDVAAAESATPVSALDREDIRRTPGAARTNSLAMITDYAPGAYMTHDMLHIRGGHQVSWLIDGVPIPNTNIGSNVGAQIDPRDIDGLEVERGSYTADTGDRTFGVFNIAPRTGFERNREAELLLTAGNFNQTDDQLSVGDHSERFAYYASVNGNRSDYGLAPPTAAVVHDAANGFGGFTSLIFNRTPHDQLRAVAQVRKDFFQIPFDPDPDSIGNSLYNSSGLRDAQRENDGFAAFSWLHTFHRTTTLEISPFVHGNHVAYQALPTDVPVATNVSRTSLYSGGQLVTMSQIGGNVVQAGVYGFAQHDNESLAAAFNDGSGASALRQGDTLGAGVAEFWISDNLKVNSWITILAGLRHTTFAGSLSEGYTAPRIGASIRVPGLNWILRGFYGRFYQPPPLLTASGPVLAYARSNDTTLIPLHGERDEEHQFGVQIPWRGWLLDADTFATRINNFLDHSNIGSSSLYFPVTIDGARVRAWELTLRSPHLARFGQAHLAYSNQIAEQRGGITGGLVCTPIGDPACDAGFTYTPVDHDQRNTLSAGFNASLPRQTFASVNVAYGSGFSNGGYDPVAPADPAYPNRYLPAHTSVDVSAGKDFGKRLSLSLTATNLAGQRKLVDNSLTFGGFHFSDPRQVYAQLRYRFRY